MPSPARRRLALLLALLCGPSAYAQAPLPLETFAQFTDSLAAVAAIPDAAEREAAVGALWDALVDADQIPFRLGDEAAFLWRGTASTVRVAGDHNGWSPGNGPLARVGLSYVWMRTYTFPEAARLDYKLVIDGTWILDPANPHRQWSGFGPNSELRMPAWVFPEETVRDPATPAGTFGPNQTLASTHVGYGVRYRVFTPAGYDAQALSDLPVLYVTDGHEYSDDQLGAARIVLDNLIADGRAEPALAVFIDPRVNGQNLRQEQYVQNPDFAAFVAEELVPTIDAAFRTRAERDGRVILGTSLGGLFSAYLGLLHPDTFGKLAIQSPAFWVSESLAWWTGPSIYAMMEEAGATFEVYMSTGTINDTEDGARQMRDVFNANGHALTYREVPEGHSWGNWRALIDEVLVALVPGENATTGEDGLGAAPALELAPYPNPAREHVTFGFTLDAPAHVRLACYDLLGRPSYRRTETLLAGEHTVAVDTQRLGAAGTYLCRLATGKTSVTRSVTVVR